jgi:hypothetical protein
VKDNCCCQKIISLTYLVVFFNNAGGSPLGNERAEPVLEGQLDDVPVGEEVPEEGLHLLAGARPAHVQHQDTGLHLRIEDSFTTALAR